MSRLWLKYELMGTVSLSVVFVGPSSVADRTVRGVGLFMLKLIFMLKLMFQLKLMLE